MGLSESIWISFAGPSRVFGKNQKTSLAKKGSFMTKREEYLKQVASLLDGRERNYGPPQKMYGHLAKRWSALLGVTISPRDAALMMLDLKIVREYLNPGMSSDTLQDLVGYAKLAGEVDHVKTKT